jgi:hypothetical protein
MSGFAEEALPEGWDVLRRADALALAPPEGAKERVRRQLAATLGLAAGLGAAGAVATAAAGGAAASPLPAEGLLSAAAKALLLKKVVVVAVVAATAVTGGTAAYVEVRAQRAAAQQALTEKGRAKTTAALAPVLPAPAKVAAAEEAAPAIQPDTLGEEHALLDEARSAISRGRLAEAQGLLERHAMAFPTGLLVEERQALHIRLLVRQGQPAEAARGAARFRQEHPHSIQQPGIDEALRSSRR